MKRLVEEYLGKDKKLYAGFIDPEKVQLAIQSSVTLSSKFGSAAPTVMYLYGAEGGYC